MHNVSSIRQINNKYVNALNICWINKMYNVKYLMKYTLPLISLVLMLSIYACNGKVETKHDRVEDIQAKKQLQGTWVNDIEGNIVFYFRGDSVFYDDSLSTPVTFHVYHDTLFIDNHPLTAYPIKKLDSTELCFVNSEGDETTLVRAGKDVIPLARGEYKGAVTLNQRRKIKNDTVMIYKDKHYHAYTQVNPTTYKVYRQTTNNDGLRVESLYYDNIVYIALYEGQRKVFGSNITKADFAGMVPQAYLDQAVLSEILVDNATERGVRFIAVLSIPDSYTNYRVNIDIDMLGKKTLSV